MGPRGRTRWRVAAAVAAAGTAAGVLAGCSGIRTAPREVVVVFDPGATAAQREAVHAGCDGIPEVTPEAMPTTSLASDRVYGVRFDVTDAGTGALSKLYKCIGTFPGVTGYTLTDTNFDN